MTLKTLIRSSIFRKALVGLTGAFLLLFVVGHLAGNLGIFGGRDAFNGYAYFLKSKPLLLWAARLGLLAVLTVHVGIAGTLTLENSAARPQPYHVDATRKASRASRTMMISGAVILAFVVFHLLHFTIGTIYPSDFASHETVAGIDRHDAFSMVLKGFNHTWIVVLYLGAMAVLFFHLTHGVSSMFQSTGTKHRRYVCVTNRSGQLVAVLIFAGYAVIPLAVRVGLLKLP